MSQEPALLQAILNDPDDDALRLVYADWLEEHGDPRSEFIRVQLQLARLPRTDPAYRRLWERELELIRAHKEEWFGAMRQQFMAWDVQRGFINHVTAELAVFMDKAPELCAAHPVESLVLHIHDGRGRSVQRGELLQGMVESDWLPRLIKLEVFTNTPRLTDEEFGRQLAERGPWPRLKTIRLATFQMTGPTQTLLRDSFGKRLTLEVPQPNQQRRRRQIDS